MPGPDGAEGAPDAAEPQVTGGLLAAAYHVLFALEWLLSTRFVSPFALPQTVEIGITATDGGSQSVDATNGFTYQVALVTDAGGAVADSAWLPVTILAGRFYAQIPAGTLPGNYFLAWRVSAGEADGDIDGGILPAFVLSIV